jgi:hypothetical protein
MKGPSTYRTQGASSCRSIFCVKTLTALTLGKACSVGLLKFSSLHLQAMTLKFKKALGIRTSPIHNSWDCWGRMTPLGLLKILSPHPQAMRLEEKALRNWPSSIHNSWDQWVAEYWNASKPARQPESKPANNNRGNNTTCRADICHKILQPYFFGCSVDRNQALQEVDMQLSELDIRILAHKIIISEILKLLAIQSDH